MTRIYFDTNVFSNLKKNQHSLYQELNKLIEHYRDNVSYMFSHAHVRDKKNDETELKYDDLAFMESIVKNNYLCYHGEAKATSFYLATPTVAFKDEIETPETNNLLAFLYNDPEDEPEIIALKENLRSLLLATTIPTDLLDLKSIPNDQKEFIQKFLPANQDHISMLDIFKNFENFYHELFSNSQTYRDLRKLIDENLNRGKYSTANGSLDFDRALKNSIFKKSFTDYILDAFKQQSQKEEIPYYDFFLQAYNSLDLLGISKDKLSRKNTYNNLFNDGLHSYYARYCDYLVTDDEGLQRKSKTLYNLYESATRVLSVEEFINAFPSIGKNTEDDVEELLKNLVNNTTDKYILKHEVIDTGHYTIFLPETNYLNAFDEIITLMHNEEHYIFLNKNDKHWLSQMNFHEIGMLIKKCLSLFGTDLLKHKTFDFEIEVEEIRNKKWRGRHWKIGNTSFCLHYSEIIKKITLALGPLPTYE